MGSCIARHLVIRSPGVGKIHMLHAQASLEGFEPRGEGGGSRPAGGQELGPKAGLFPRQQIRLMIQRKMIASIVEIEDAQLQPASLDLRLGSKAFRIRASFLPGRNRTVQSQLDEIQYDEIALDDGAVLERNCVYLVELQEFVKLQPTITGIANPKSSTGRLDVFIRLITDGAEVFDLVEGGYEGPLYAEISPRSFSIKVHKGSRLNQLRFRRRNSQQSSYEPNVLSDRELRDRHENSPLVDGELNLRKGLVLRVGLSPTSLDQDIIGYRAQTFTNTIDVDKVAEYDYRDYWEPLSSRDQDKLILDPQQFYILASKERLHIPPDLAAEMVPIDPSMGEFRVHYAGFFDPGFGFSEHGHPGSRAVLEVRSHETPFTLEDGQIVGRLAYEALTEVPDILYGQTLVSNYQGQSLKLSKHFRV
jgi:dCTP deaminase